MLLNRDGYHLITRNNEASKINDITSKDSVVTAAEHLIIDIRVDANAYFIILCCLIIAVKGIQEVIELHGFLGALYLFIIDFI